MTTFHIDKIKVRESSERMEVWRRSLERGQEASEALLWFEEFAQADSAGRVLSIRAGVVASSTPGAERAVAFVQKALDEHLDSILARAVAIAHAQHKSASDTVSKITRKDAHDHSSRS